jgi:hypothetical protein
MEMMCIIIGMFSCSFNFTGECKISHEDSSKIMCSACRYRRCFKKFKNPEKLLNVAKIMKQHDIDEFPTRCFVMRRRKIKSEFKTEPSPRKQKEEDQGEPEEVKEEVEKEKEKSTESQQEMKSEVKPAIGKPALWSTRTSTATFVKKVPWISPKMARPLGKGSVCVPCGGVGSSDDRKPTVPKHDASIDRTLGEFTVETIPLLQFKGNEMYFVLMICEC